MIFGNKNLNDFWGQVFIILGYKNLNIFEVMFFIILGYKNLNDFWGQVLHDFLEARISMISGGQISLEG